MADVKETVEFGDSKGRSFPDKDPRPQIIDLHEKLFADLERPGDYCWDYFLAEKRYIVLSCPFCGTTLPLPLLTVVENVDPLTLAEELTCGVCSQGFHIIKGQAIKSWGHLKMEGR